MFIRCTSYLMISLLLLLAGCTRENLDNCSADLRLKFTFTLHLNGDNRFGPDVQLVKVYFFDESGMLAHIQQGQGTILTNNYVMNVQLPPGKYTIIAWGGSNEDFTNSFHEGHMNDPLTHDYEMGVTIGKTTLADFRIFLNYGIADNYPEDIMPTIEEFDDLYFGAAGTRQSGSSKYVFEQVEVKTGMVNEKLIELIRNTNILKVTINGLENLQNSSTHSIFSAKGVPSAADILQVWVSARNGRYKYDNTIGEYARMMRFPAIYRYLDEHSMVVDIKTMQLDIVRHKAEAMYLTIQNPITKVTYPQQPIDVVNTLLQAKNPETGEYIYQSQEDFDKYYEHPIDIEITADFQVRIFIHGWEVITVKPEI